MTKAADPIVDVQQIIHALRRAERRLQSEADALLRAGDYSAEFPAEDAERMREAIALLQARPVAVASRAVPHDLERILETLPAHAAMAVRRSWAGG